MNAWCAGPVVAGRRRAALPRAGRRTAIEKAVEVAAPLDEAWDAWTTREGIVSFFAPDAASKPRVGGAFQIHIDPGAPRRQQGRRRHAFHGAAADEA